jgi:PX domain
VLKKKKIKMSSESKAKVFVKEVKLMPVPTEGTTVAMYLLVAAFNGKRGEGLRRFSDFAELDSNLRRDNPMLGYEDWPELPPKRFKMFTDHTDPEFLEERRAGLEAYLGNLVAKQQLLEDDRLLEFLFLIKRR